LDHPGERGSSGEDLTSINRFEKEGRRRAAEYRRATFFSPARSMQTIRLAGVSDSRIVSLGCQ
jgi:hypothetical protein